MKKILGMLVVCLGFWFTGLTVVHADIKPLPPDYDPIQGGMILRPPHDLWIKADNKTTIPIIPIAYLPGGQIDIAQLKQLNYRVILNDTSFAVPVVSKQSDVPSIIPGLSLGIVRTNGLGIFVRASEVGDYSMQILMRIGQENDEYETEVILHVVDQISEITSVEEPAKPILSPLPQLALWHHVGGEVTIEENITTTAAALNNNELGWPTSPLFYFLPATNSTLVNDVERLGTFKLGTLQRQLTVVGGIGTQQFGIPLITAIQGQSLNLDFDYMKPNPGTKLTFIWEFYSIKADLLSTQSTQTPELPAAFVQPNAASVRLILEYSDNQTTIKYASAFINFAYKSQPLLSIPPAEATVNLPAIIQGPTTTNAGLADWSVTQVGQWHFEITVSTLRQADGTTLPAKLKWPDGTSITPYQPYTIKYKYSGSQVVPLSQLDWVFQQQPKAKAGHYQADLLFEAISGP
jgi:hypothetical protein